MLRKHTVRSLGRLNHLGLRRLVHIASLTQMGSLCTGLVHGT